MLRELKIYFKNNIKIVSIMYIQVTLMLILVGTFFYFLYSIDSVETGFKEIYAEKAIFQLSNDYYNEKYEEFLKKQDTLTIKKNFYNKINNEKDFEYLSLKEHYISINSNKIPDEFRIVYSDNKYQFEEIEGKKYSMVKSYQMNKESFDFFGLEVSEGKSWNDEDFHYNGYIPILLGNSYKDIFKIGEKIEVGYFGTKFDGKIIGFLKDNSKVLGNGNIESSLNQYVILPHINFEEPLNNKERTFQDVAYFMMLEGYIVTEDNQEVIRNMKDKVELMAQESQFTEYFFMGSNPHIKSYVNTMTILNENKELTLIILTFIGIFNILILCISFWIKNKRRISYYSLHYMLGSKKGKLLIQQWLEIEIIFLAAFITYFIISYEILYLYTFSVYLILFILINLMSVLISIISSKTIITNSVGIGLNYIDNGGI